MEFTVTKRAKTISMLFMVVGLIAAVIGIMGDHTDHHQRTWANLLVNGFFFFGVSLGTLYFFALQYATEAGWTVLVKRVYEAIIAYLPVGAVVLLIVFLAGTFDMHHIWHWMDHNVTDPTSPAYDAMIDHKSAYLNKPFFWIRTIIYLAVFILFARWFRKQSLKMDEMSGDGLVKTHLLNYRRGALFLVLFAVFSSMLSWDWLMSIDAHWFSTLFGWYVFSGMWVSAMITAVIMVLYLKRKGYLPQVNNSHIQDMGKWVFAISFLWSYLWFSQFMLIWYANIPEEVTYFITRIDHFKWLFFGTFFINFAIPMVLLMSRDAKRNPRFLIGVGVVIFIGHWLDVLVMVMPGAVGHQHFHSLGLLEIGMGLAFLGLFMYVVLNALSKAPLTPAHHPYLDESIHHQI